LGECAVGNPSSAWSLRSNMPQRGIPTALPRPDSYRGSTASAVVWR
jgi:hypothetical protein